MTDVRLIVRLVFVAVLHEAHADQKERELYKMLMEDYEVLERPAANNSLPVTVTLSIALQQLIDMDEQNQILTMNAWLNYNWNDYNLVWNPDDYGGISSVRFPASTVWRPDVLLYNRQGVVFVLFSVDSSFDSTYQTNVVVYSDGSINWIPPGIFKISCKIDITFFPFDEQLCFLKFGSWTFDGTKLDLQPDNVTFENGFDMSDYQVNGEWNLAEQFVARSEKFYDCCPEPYPDVKFFLRLRRRTLYYGFNLILPSILITFMTTMGFLLPPDAGEKITLQITVMLSICFFLNIVSTMVPPTSEAIPLLGWLFCVFFSSCMMVVSTSVVATVWILNLHYRTASTHEMGRLSKVILLNWLPWLLWMQRPGHSFTYTTLPPLFAIDLDDNSESLLRNVRASSAQNDNERHRHQSLDLEQRISRCLKLLACTESQISLGQQAVVLMLQRIYTQLKFITNRMADQDEDDQAEAEWQFAAMVLDRLCLVILSVAICASMLYIYMAAPYLSAG